MSKKTYVWRKKEGDDAYSDGFSPTDILVQHYNDEKFRTILLREDDFKNLKPWEFCSILNEVYKSGRNDAMEDLRRFIGVEK
jgi:hypothetical protein